MVKKRNETTVTKNRILGLDIIRGLALINMVIYHLLYDLVYIFNQSISWFSINKAFIWQQMICCTFIIISGISFNLSKKPLKNGIKLMVCAVILTMVTFFFMPDELILFGILHFLAAAIFITSLMMPLLKRIPEKFGLPLVFILFIIFRYLPAGNLSFFSLSFYNVPPGFYQSELLFFIGLPHVNFKSADYFPLLPWWFLYLAGFYSSSYYLKINSLLQEKFSVNGKKIYKLFDFFLGFLGRNSLFIYMLHQPIIYGLIILVYFFS